MLVHILLLECVKDLFPIYWEFLELIYPFK